MIVVYTFDSLVGEIEMFGFVVLLGSLLFLLVVIFVGNKIWRL